MLTSLPGYAAATRAQAASCMDTIKNGQESDVDCGGSCAPCATAKTCTKGMDCISGVCKTTCQVAQAMLYTLLAFACLWQEGQGWEAGAVHTTKSRQRTSQAPSLGAFCLVSYRY